MKKPYVITNDRFPDWSLSFNDEKELWNWIEENAEPIETYEIENKHKKCIITIRFFGVE